MRRTLLKSKIHRAVLTATELEYEGSITIPSELMEAADLVPHERVQVLNLSTGDRLETYVIEGAAGSSEICLNGPAARQGVPGDEIIVASYAAYDEEEATAHEPTVVQVDERNRPVAPRLASES